MQFLKFYKNKIARIFVVMILTFNLNAYAEPAKNHIAELTNGSRLSVTVVDSATKEPMELVNLILRDEENRIVTTTVTDPHGEAVFRNVTHGEYTLLAHYIGYKDYSNVFRINKENKKIKILLVQTEIGLSDVVVNATKEVHVSNYIDTKSGNPVFLSETYHAPPLDRLTTLIQENVPGAVREPTGETVIRDQHVEYSTSTYYLNGVPVPLGALGDLNEIVDPETIQRITTYTGGFPAEYGGQSAAVFDIQNKIPQTNFHLNFSSYLGSYLTSNNGNAGDNVGAFKALNSNGQNLSVTNGMGNFRYFISGTRQETDRRIDQPIINLFNDHGFDYLLYGKFDYLLSNEDYLTSNINYSNTYTEIPFDPVEGINYDTQNSYNSFQTLSLYHNFSESGENENKIMIALYSSERGIKFNTNNKYDETRQFINDDTTTSYTIDQNRKYLTYGTRIKYTDRLSDEFLYAAGFRFNSTSSKEEFQFKDFQGNGPLSNMNYSSSNFGAFVQTQINPLDEIQLDAGVRYDQNISPSLGLQNQVSPRLKLSYFLSQANTLYMSYDRLFVPTNVEGLDYVSLIINGQTSDSWTHPERDNLYSIGFIHDFDFGLSAKLDYYYKLASPGLDDESLGASSIIINVNIAKVKTQGIEVALDYNKPESPFSFYVNSTVMHGYGEGEISGGFLPVEESDAPYDLDHDQRLTLAAGFNYQPSNWFANLQVNYGSGLTNGNDDYNFKTGLFDFNQGAHTTPAWILDVSAGYTFETEDGYTIQPSLYVTNLLDHEHLIKGAFLNSAVYEARRNVVFKIRLGI
jgi:TonB dependent receptor-like, beta-barrel/CarboxypepD_reg-like domain